MSQAQGYTRHRFGLPLNETEATQDIACRKKALEIALTTGFEVLIFLLESRMAACDQSTPLCIHPKTDGTFEIMPPALGGTNIPQCMVGINFLWSSSDKESFRSEAAVSFDSWLLEYAGFLGSRIQPRCPKLWKDVYTANSLTSIVLNFLEVQKKLKETERGKLICSICKSFKKDYGVCCSKCVCWAHVCCLGSPPTNDVQKEELPLKYICTSCQKS